MAVLGRFYCTALVYLNTCMLHIGFRLKRNFGFVPIFPIKCRDISGPKYEWAMKMGQWPTFHSFACKNQDFNGPFEIVMGHLKF